MNKLSFETKKEAIAFLKSIKNFGQLTDGNFYPLGTYYTKHGEYSQPEFKAVRYKDGWGIKKIHFYYASTFNAPKDGRCCLLDDELVLA